MAGAFFAGALAAGVFTGAAALPATVFVAATVFGRALPWLLVAPGLALVWGGLLVRHAHDGGAVHASVMAAGGLLIGAAHLVNLRLSFGHAH